jgi:predicted secreted hydrolase
MNLTLKPEIADQEVFGGVLPPYWEGTVTVSGTVNGRQVSGVGSVEMVAY